MKPLNAFFGLMALLIVFSATALAQTPAEAKQFAKDGLSFSYPNGWTMEDTSNAEAQQFNIGRADSEAQMRLFVYRTHVTSPERPGRGAQSFD